MANGKLMEVFLETKEILCRNDYYLHIPKKIIKVTNTENMIPHLMGLQYIARPDMFTGDRGVYMIKKGRLKYNSLEKLVGKYYKNPTKRASILAMVNGKIDNLCHIKDMLSTYSVLYLYDTSANPELKLKTDYLMVNQQKKKVLQLGFVRAANKKVVEYHCNSFMVDYKGNSDYDLYYRNLTKRYEISRIIRENKQTKRAQVIYLSEDAKQRELSGIRGMLATDNIESLEKLVNVLFRLNMKFGIYHTMDMLNDSAGLLEKCMDKEETALVMEYLKLQGKKLTLS